MIQWTPEIEALYKEFILGETLPQEDDPQPIIVEERR